MLGAQARNNNGTRTASARDVATHPDQAQAMLERLFLQRTLQGEDDAFVVLGSMYSEQVYAIARNLSSSDEDALELTQGAFRRAREELSAISPKLSFRVLVCRLLGRRALKLLHHAMPLASDSLEPLFRRFEDGKHAPAQPCDCADIHALARRRDIAERIRGALGGLTAEDRAAFVLWMIEELPLDEAAAILEIPASLVRQRANRACLLLSGYFRQLVDDAPAKH